MNHDPQPRSEPEGLCASCGARTASAITCDACAADPRLLERWLLLEEVGAGAFGTTWRARDTRDGTIVAIKEMLIRRASALKNFELFEREARILESLEHPGIPRYLHDFVRDAGRHSAFHLVQEFVEGTTLAARYAGRPIRVDEALRIGDRLLDILEYLHTFSPPVVHRDIKPANVMCGPDGRIVLIDFGSVRAALDSAQGGSTVAGTFGFMAPEQFMGRAVPRSDVFGVAATLVALLADAEPHALTRADRSFDVARLGLAKPLEHALERMLDLDDARRPDASEARRLLADAARSPRAASRAERREPTQEPDVVRAAPRDDDVGDTEDRSLDPFVLYPEMPTAHLSATQRSEVERRRLAAAVLETSVTLPAMRTEEHGAFGVVSAVVAAGLLLAMFVAAALGTPSAERREADLAREREMYDQIAVRAQEQQRRELDQLLASFRHVGDVASTTPILPPDEQDRIRAGADGPFLGGRGAPRFVALYTTFDCIHCVAVREELETLLAEDPDALRIQVYALALSPRARQLGSIAHCAWEQRQFAAVYPALHQDAESASDPADLDELLADIAIDRRALDECLASARPGAALDRNRAHARSVGSQGVPAVHVDGRRVEEPWLPGRIRAALAR